MKSPPYSEIVRMRLVGNEPPFPKGRYDTDCHQCIYVYRIPVFDGEFRYFCAKNKFSEGKEAQLTIREQCHFFKEVPVGTDGYPEIDPKTKTLIDNRPMHNVPKRIEKYCFRHFKKNRQLCQKSHNERKKKSA